MDGYFFTDSPCGLHGWRPGEALHLRDDRFLAKFTQFSIGPRPALPAPELLIGHFADWFQPVVDKPKALSANRGSDSSTTVVSANNDMLDVQLIDRVLHYRQHIKICRVDEVGNVPVNKNFSRFKARDDIGRHTAIRTADPKIFGLLEPRQIFKVVRVFSSSLLRPSLISA